MQIGGLKADTLKQYRHIIALFVQLPFPAFSGEPTDIKVTRGHMSGARPTKTTASLLPLFPRIFFLYLEPVIM